VLLLLACSPLAVVAGARPARAGDAFVESARSVAIDAEVDRLATRGQQLLDRGETQAAIAAFRRAYELRADARFLYDIAECYRQLGLVDQALHFYQSYLSAAPDAPDRDDVEAQIAALERRGPAPQPPAPALKPSFQNDVVIVPVPEGPAPDASHERPLWKRWWVWTAVGVVVVGGTVLAFTLGRDKTEVPPTALGDKTFY
jgi:tetratricopeptide (TPR) repeat protein